MNTRASRILFVCLKILAGIVGLAVLGAIILVVFLTSSSGSKFILSEAKTAIERSPGNVLEYKSGELNILKGLHFKNLHIVWRQDGLDAVVDIDSLDIDYDFSILQRHVKVTDFLVVHPKMTIKLSAAQETKKETKSTSFDDLLRDPPVNFEIAKFSIEKLDMDYEQDQPAVDKTVASKTIAHIKGLDFSLSFAILKEFLKAEGALSVVEPIKLEMKSESQDIAARVAANGKWSLKIHREKNWIYEIAPVDFSASFTDVSASQRKAGGDTTIRLADGALSSHSLILAHTTALFKPDNKTDANAVDTVDVDSKLTLGKLSVMQKGVKPIEVGSETVHLTSKLADKIDIEFDYRAVGIRADQYLSRAVGFNLKSKAQITRALAHLTLDTQARLADLDLFDLKTQVDMIDSTHAVGDLALNADPKLADSVIGAQALKKMGAVRVDAKFDVTRSQDGDVAFRITSGLPAILLPSLTKPSSLDVACDGAWKPKAKHLDFNGDIGFGNDDYGQWKFATKFDLSLADEAANAPLKTHGLTTVAQISRAVKVPAGFPKPFTIEHSVEMGGKKADVDIVADIPHIDLDKVGSVDDTRLKLHAKSIGLAGPKNVDIELTLKQGRIAILGRNDVNAIKNGVSIAGVDVSMKASVRDGVSFTLEQFKAGFDGSAVVMTAQATGNTQTKDAQGQFDVSVEIPAGFPEINGQKLKGRIEIPAQLAVYRGREASLSGSVGLTDFSVKKTNVALEGITGRVPFSEKLKWDGNNIRFTELINENPFERVDFERVRPLLQGAEPLNIRAIRWEEKVYGPFVGFFSLAQNMLYAHQFDLDLGTGHVNGELFLDIYPSNLQLGVLSRLIGVNLAQVLPSRFLAKMPGGDKNISMRSGFVLGLNHATMDGRVDITEIGGPQLVAMINVLDPNYEDEKMNKVRSLLNVGYPTSVGLKFAEGYMDMDIGLDILGLKQMESIHEVPIASMVSNATSEIVKETERGPLK